MACINVYLQAHLRFLCYRCFASISRHTTLAEQWAEFCIIPSEGFGAPFEGSEDVEQNGYISFLMLSFYVGALFYVLNPFYLGVGWCEKLEDCEKGRAIRSMPLY